MAKKSDKLGEALSSKKEGGIREHLFTTPEPELPLFRRRTKARKKADIMDSNILPDHWRYKEVQSANILVPVLDPFKVEAVRQKKTLKALISEILFEAGLERGIITQDEIKKK